MLTLTSRVTKRGKSDGNNEKLSYAKKLRGNAFNKQRKMYRTERITTTNINSDVKGKILTERKVVGYRGKVRRMLKGQEKS